MSPSSSPTQEPEISLSGRLTTLYEEVGYVTCLVLGDEEVPITFSDENGTVIATTRSTPQRTNPQVFTDDCWGISQYQVLLPVREFYTVEVEGEFVITVPFEQVSSSLRLPLRVELTA